MLNICITFDYELFFNESFCSEYEALILPTKHLSDVLNKKGVKSTLFADVSSLLRYQELNMHEYPEHARSQLQKLYKQGHDVQMHIHPHWYNTNFVGGEWVFDNSHYRIHKFGFEKDGDKHHKSGVSIIDESVDYLNDLVGAIDSGYKCIAFRAGGFCLQPEKHFLSALYAKGIRVDSSVCKGIQKDSGIHYYSFHNMPTQPNWWVDPEQGLQVPVEPMSDGSIFEIPIGSFGAKPSKWILSKLYPKLIMPPRKGGHTPNSLQPQNFARRYASYAKNIWSQSLIFTLDGYHYDVLLKFVDEYLKKYPADNNDYYISLICHPKFSNEVLVHNMEEFIDHILKDYSGRIQFLTISEAYQKAIKAL
jgi:hypothetical protein